MGVPVHASIGAHEEFATFDLGQSTVDASEGLGKNPLILGDQARSSLSTFAHVQRYGKLRRTAGACE